MGMFGGSFKGGARDLAALQFVPGAPQLNAGGGIFGRYQPPQAAPPVAAPAAPPAGGKGPSFGRVLDGVLGGSTITEVKDAYRARKAAEARQQQYLQMVESLNLSPEEKLIALNDPEEFMKAVATRHAYHAEDGGKTVFNAPGQGGRPLVTQKLVEDGGIYGTQSADGYTQTGQRGMSHTETETARKNDADIAHAAALLGIQKEQLAEMVRNHKATEGIGYGNLGMRGKEFEARKAAGGFGTPGVGGVLGPSLDPNEWEPVR